MLRSLLLTGVLAVSAAALTSCAGAAADTDTTDAQISDAVGLFSTHGDCPDDLVARVDPGIDPVVLQVELCGASCTDITSTNVVRDDDQTTERHFTCHAGDTWTATWVGAAG
jgi:hypothetical protein